MKLGKHAARHDSRTLQLATYLAAELPPAPAKVNYAARIAPGGWGMMGNDALGDCTIAAVGHLIMGWTSLSRPAPVVLSDDEIVTGYSAVTGYDPADPSSDQGAVELDVLRYWRRTGFGTAHDKIGAFVALEPKNHEHVKSAVAYFENCYIGLALPVSAQNQSVWSVPPGGPTGSGAPGSWGGHAVPILGYDAQGLICVTWGAVKRMTWGFWEAYCDEAYCVLSKDTIDGTGKTAVHLDWKTLAADLRSVAH